MANMGDLDKYLNESGKISDYSWLDIDPKDYKNIPFNSIPEYIAIPKLEEQWKHLKDKHNNPNLTPNMDLNYNNKIPDKTNNDTKDLLDHIKKQMMSGRTGKELVEDIYSRADLKVIKAAMGKITELLKEQGLLGNIYVDPTPFSKCVEGANFTDKRNKTARYVKEISACSDCIFNKKERCEVYKKTIASDIEYDENLLSFYAKHLSNLRGKEIVINSKEELKKAFLEKIVVKVKIAENKPIEKSEEKTLEDKKKEFEEQYKDLEKQLSNFPTDKISKDIANLLIKGYSGKIIKSYIRERYSEEEFKKNKKTFDNILLKQGSLGRVYIESDLIPQENCAAAKDYVKQNASDVKYIVVSPQKPFCNCRENHSPSGTLCRNLNKTIVPDVNSIPAQAWVKELNKYPEVIAEKVSSIFEKDKIQGLRLAFLSNGLTITNNSKIVESYELSSCLDNTSYTPKSSEKIILTSNKIANALNKGFKISSIMNMGKKIGMSEEILLEKIKKALSNLDFIKKYQLDVPVLMPKNLKIVTTQKDISIDMKKSFEVILDSKVNSSSAPTDNLLASMNLQASTLDVGEFHKKKKDLEITGLNQFSID